MLGRTPIKTRSKAALCESRRHGNEGDESNVRHCKACMDEDDTDMVQCDDCDDWYHFKCVGVNQEIAHHDWCCSHCQTNKEAKNNTSTNVSAPHLATEPLPVLNSNMPLELSKHHYRNDKKQGFRENACQHSETSKNSTRRKQLQLELQMLDEERKLQESEEAKKREYLHKRYELLKEIASETSSVIESEEEEMGEKVSRWLEDEIDINRVPVHQVTQPRQPKVESIFPPPIMQQGQGQPKFILRNPRNVQPNSQQNQQESCLQRITTPAFRQQGLFTQQIEPKFVPEIRRMKIQDDESFIDNQQLAEYNFPH
ncbi:uncharacterized protein LOC129765562 [Toxorhynchites rutilus septentrionalis]|uniref:uncharacterized protein LOC129765562 n=1 Tax=Toxorhynchites rutilus septentrionalis TaxID=329112 RepID=UPI0024793C1B|nr:uncharacterized protein LOC129765562 [Toxorhynchites rutilus septentrionalis]